MSDEKIISANSSDKKISCSFCGKSQEEVKKLIAGPNVYICNECVVLCKDILVEDDKIDTKKKFEIPKYVKFQHGKSFKLKNGVNLVGCYHPSPRNVNTGRINEKMMTKLFLKVKKLD